MNSDQEGEPGSGLVPEAPESPSPAQTKKTKERNPRSNIITLKRETDEDIRPAAPTLIRKRSGASKQEPGVGAAPEKPAGPDLPATALLAAGKSLREKVPRQAHAAFKRDKNKVDALVILSKAAVRAGKIAVQLEG